MKYCKNDMKKVAEYMDWRSKTNQKRRYQEWLGDPECPREALGLDKEGLEQRRFFAHLGWGKENRGFQFFINAGPQIGLFLSDEEFYGFTQEKPWDPSNRPNNQTAQYGKKVENTLEYGIAGGAGIELKTGIGNFIVEGRYFFGLSDMFGNSKADPFGRSANTTITAKITYLVDILK